MKQALRSLPIVLALWGFVSTPLAFAAVRRAQFTVDAKPTREGVKLVVRLKYDPRKQTPPVTFFVNADGRWKRTGPNVLLTSKKVFPKKEMTVTFFLSKADLAKLGAGGGRYLYLVGVYRVNSWTNHHWGGPNRGGRFRVPSSKALLTSVQEPSTQLKGGPSAGKVADLDTAQPITKALITQHPGASGLKVGGQIRSRLEMEGKFQLTAEEFETSREELFRLAQDASAAREIFGSDWTLKVIKCYLLKTPSGSTQSSGGFPVPDPMVDTYYDNAEMDAAKNDMAIRYRYTAGNRTGTWNFKPGLGEVDPSGAVYRTEYGVDTKGGDPKQISKFAASVSNPLNFFNLIREVIPDQRPETFFKPAVKVTDTRYKFLLENESGLQIEISLDAVEAENLRSPRNSDGLKKVSFYQLELDVDHLAMVSRNTSPPTAASRANVVYLHHPKDTRPKSKLRVQEQEAFDESTTAIEKLRDHLLGPKEFVIGAQKYAFSAFLLGMIAEDDMSRHTRQVSESMEEKNAPSFEAQARACYDVFIF